MTGRLDDNCLKERWSKEAEEFRKRKWNHGGGVFNLFILDTSESMNGKGFCEMKEAYLSIIEGFSVHPMLDENVAVIQFGKDVKYLHYFSNNCDSLKRVLDDVSCSGPSPMIEGFLLALPALESGHTTQIGPFSVRMRVILISDGKPTISSDSESNSLDNDETGDQNVQLLDLARQIGSTNPIICVPVGNEPHISLLQSIAYGSRGGKILNYNKAREYARYTLNMAIARNILGEVPPSFCTIDDVKNKVLSKGFYYHVTNHDLEDVVEILNNRSAYEMYVYRNEEHLEQSVYSERDEFLLAPGTRVRRGPQWHYNDQDSYRPGTVIGHDKKGGIFVEWDTGMRFDYEYVRENQEQFVVIACDEPRILQKENIAVGCLVKRGPDWKWENEDGGVGSFGAVYRVKENMVYVRWSNGNKSICRFGSDDKFDIVICDPFDASTVTFLRKCKPASSSECIGGGVTDLNTTTRSQSPTQKDKTKSGGSIEQNSDGINNGDKASQNVYSAGSNEEYDEAVLWQWKNEQGRWRNFPETENQKIKKEFAKNSKSTILLEIDETMFRLVLSKMKLINILSRKTFDVRCFEDNFDGKD